MSERERDALMFGSRENINRFSDWRAEPVVSVERELFSLLNVPGLYKGLDIE